MFGLMKLWRRGRDHRRHRSVEALSRAIVPVVEAMEARRMLAACSLSGGTLTCDGDSDTDVIMVEKVGSDIEVEVDEIVIWDNPESWITAGIVVNGLNGDDDICILNVSTSIPITINGGAGNDMLQGGAGAETLNGEGGNDDIKGGPGNDYLSGGADSDTLMGSDNDGNDTMSGGDQLDTMDYRNKTGNLTITVGSGANDGASGESDDVQSDVETVIGGSGNDHITGDSSNEHLEGYHGNDTLVGGSGTAADTLDGGDGTGIDTADYSARTDNLKITLDGVNNDGNETAGEGDDVRDVDIVIGGSGQDTIIGDINDNTLVGNAGNDSIQGGNGNDSIAGGDGTDVLDGDADNDSIEGGAGYDTIYGDGGQDTLKGGTSDYGNLVYGGDDADHIYGYGVLYGEGGNDKFYTWNGFTDTIDGGSGTDQLHNWDEEDLDFLTSIELF